MNYFDYTAVIFLPSLNLFVSQNQDGIHKGFQVGVGAGQKHGLCEYGNAFSLYKIVTESFLDFIFLSVPLPTHPPLYIKVYTISIHFVTF